MKALLKKEFMLCLHPTCFIFLCLALFVFIPNYPYEVMFFFSGLSVFFVCLTARENGDTAFTCTLPVRKEDAVKGRMLFCIVFQTALLLCAALTVTIKQLCLPAAMQINMAGIMANTAFLGLGVLLMGVFNLIFFPLHYSDPQKIGLPFSVAAAAQFFLIGVFIVFRFSVPFFKEVLNTQDPLNFAAKIAVLAAGLAIWAGFSLLSCRISVRRFARVDL